MKLHTLNWRLCYQVSMGFANFCAGRWPHHRRTEIFVQTNRSDRPSWYIEWLIHLPSWAYVSQVFWSLAKRFETQVQLPKVRTRIWQIRYPVPSRKWPPAQISEHDAVDAQSIQFSSQNCLYIVQLLWQWTDESFVRL